MRERERKFELGRYRLSGRERKKERQREREREREISKRVREAER